MQARIDVGLELQRYELALINQLVSAKRQQTLVREWIWIDLDLPDDVREEMSRMQLQPVMLYGDVLIDSLGRFEGGDWLRSTPLVLFSQGCLFETRDTVYVLLGHGLRKRAELSAMVKIFRAEGD